MSNELIAGQTIFLRPIKGCYQKNLEVKVVRWTLKSVWLQVPGYLSPIQFSRKDGSSRCSAFAFREFPMYRAMLPENDGPVLATG